MYRSEQTKSVRRAHVQNLSSALAKPKTKVCPERSRGALSLYARGGGFTRHTDGGFTLIEILIVVVVIGIAAMIAVPMISSSASIQVRSAANMIAADLEYAKSMAISRGQNFSVVFDKNAESYWIEDQDSDVIEHPIKKGFDYIVNFANDSRLNSVDIVDVDFDSTSEVKFNYLGSPYNGGDTPLNSGVITLQAGGITKTISVEPVTGYVSIAD